MTDEVIMAKVNNFCEELKELGVDDFVFAAGSDNGLLAVQYDGDPKGIIFLAMTLPPRIRLMTFFLAPGIFSSPSAG